MRDRWRCDAHSPHLILSSERFFALCLFGCRCRHTFSQDVSHNHVTSVVFLAILNILSVVPPRKLLPKPPGLETLEYPALSLAPFADAASLRGVSVALSSAIYFRPNAPVRFLTTSSSTTNNQPAIPLSRARSRSTHTTSTYTTVRLFTYDDSPVILHVEIHKAVVSM